LSHVITQFFLDGLQPSGLGNFNVCVGGLGLTVFNPSQ
jgi:hypothetical protein